MRRAFTPVMAKKLSGDHSARSGLGGRQRSRIKRGVGAGRSAKRGTSAAATGPRGARSAPPNPAYVLPRSAPPNPAYVLAGLCFDLELDLEVVADDAAAGLELAREGHLKVAQFEDQVA